MAVPRTNTSEDAPEETIVGPAIAIRGRIDGEEDLRVEGRIEGSIALTETLYVEPSGVVIAEVEARDVVVSGILIGDVTAVNSVTLNKGAKLIGNIRSPRLIIADGASFRGDVAMDGETAPLPPARERTRATSTVPRAAIGNRSVSTSTASPTRARASVSGSYEARRATPAAPARAAAPEARREPAVARPAREVAPPARPTTRVDDDEVTVVVKHAALRKGEIPGEEDDGGGQRAKKSARIPARGRRKAGRR